MAGRNIASTRWRSTHLTIRPRSRAGTWRRNAASPPLLPTFQVVYPPRMLPATALAARSHGSPPCATSQSRSKSVLPGTGRGITEESSAATAKIPAAPRCVSQCGGAEVWCSLGTAIRAGCLTTEVIRAERSRCLDVAEGKPVVAAPTEHAADGPNGKHRQQAVQGAQFSLFEFFGVATWTLSPYPEHLWHPIGPDASRATHCDCSFRFPAFQVRAYSSLQYLSLRPAMPADSVCSLWLAQCRNPQPRNRG